MEEMCNNRRQQKNESTNQQYMFKKFHRQDKQQTHHLFNANLID